MRGGRAGRWAHRLLLGRDEERAALNGLIDAAGDGLSGALVLYGEAGMGKTALLEYSIDSVSDLQVIRIAGIERNATSALLGCIASSNLHSTV